MNRTFTLRRLAAAALACSAASALANEAVIRKTLAERLAKLPPIDEVLPAPIPGLFEVRFGGSEILYTDAKGDFIIVNGALVDTLTRTDLTALRIDKLNAIDFAKLPVKDAITIVQGKGTRRMAVFVDPNCGYCKQFERDLAQLKDVTIHTFLLPILGPDSTAKSKDIWCAADRGDSWRQWMLKGVLPGKAAARCDTEALTRNLAFGRQHRINATPATFFLDGARRPGAMPLDAVEKLLATATVPTVPAPAPARK